MFVFRNKDRSKVELVAVSNKHILQPSVELLHALREPHTEVTLDIWIRADSSDRRFEDIVFCLMNTKCEEVIVSTK